MKKSEFISLLDHPEVLGKQHIHGLQEAVREFPYFQSAQLLLTKAFHKSENINFEGQLKKAAAFASDRKRLHQLIFDQNKNHNGLHLENSNSPEVFNYPEPSAEQKDEDSLNLNDSRLASSTEENDTKPAFIPAFELVHEAIESQENSAEEELEDLLQKQVLTEAIHQSILLEVDDQIPDINQEAEEIIPASKTAQDSFGDNSNFSKFDESSAHSFSDWLNFFKEEESGETKKAMLWENTSDESKAAIAAFKPNSMVPARQDFYSAAKMAKLSVQENDDLVTETLANIYVEQGYVEKAIKAFEKLQLKYPEKKVYFAGRIKEIENHLNS